MSNPLRSLLLSFGINVEGKEKLDKVDSAVESILDKVTKLGTGLASVFIVKGITGFITDAIEAGRNLGLTAEKLGVTVDELERYRYAARQAGVEQSFADRALMMFNRQLGEAEVGSKAAGKGIGQLGGGFTAAQLSAMPLQDLLGQVADKFANMTDKGQKTQLAMKLFGRQGTALIPMLDQGAAGMKKWSQEFDELGGGIGEDFTEAAKKAGSEIKKLEFTWKVLSTRLVGDILPAFNSIIMGLTKTVVSLEWLQKHSYLAQTALISLCAAAVVAFAPFLLSIAPILATMTALYLVFDDLYTLMMGGNSIIGDFIDTLFGKDAHKTFVEDVKKGFKEFIEWVKDDGIPWIKKMWAELSEVGSGPALKTIRMIGDTLKAAWEAAKGLTAALADVLGGNFKMAGDDLNKSGRKMWDAITGGQDKSDAELNADAIREANARNSAAAWQSVADPNVPILPGYPVTSGGKPSENGLVGGVSNIYDAKPTEVNVTVTNHINTSADPAAVSQEINKSINQDALNRAIQSLPWAPGLPIPKPGG